MIVFHCQPNSPKTTARNKSESLLAFCDLMSMLFVAANLNIKFLFTN